MKGLGEIMKQAQDVQSNVEKLQRELVETEVVGEAGAGMVKVVMNGRHDVKRVSIEPEVMQDDREMLEDLLAAAVNDANRRVEKLSKEKMSGLTAGLKLPF